MGTCSRRAPLPLPYCTFTWPALGALAVRRRINAVPRLSNVLSLVLQPAATAKVANGVSRCVLMHHQVTADCSLPAPTPLPPPPPA